MTKMMELEQKLKRKELKQLVEIDIRIFIGIMACHSIVVTKFYARQNGKEEHDISSKASLAKRISFGWFEHETRGTVGER